MKQTHTDPSSKASKVRTVNRREELEKYIREKIVPIQKGYVANPRAPWTAAALANLRRAATRPPGATPETWALEFEGLPESLVGDKDEQPSRGEWAVHTALGLYAIHQRSQTDPMHYVEPHDRDKKDRDEKDRSRQFGLGAAVRQLDQRARSQGDNSPDGKLPASFAALGTATGRDEIAHYLRMLVHQLASANQPIQLDYGRLAGQLYDIQNPAKADNVRLEWGREFAGWQPPDTTTTETTTTSSTEKGE